MRILVVSDSHGRRDRLARAAAEQPGAAALLHLGDGAGDTQELNLSARCRLVQVAGNNDYASLLPYDELLRFDSTCIYMTHGHRYRVKSSPEEAIAKARQAGAHILLYGHTHQAGYWYRDGLHIMNPGTVGGIGAPPAYGIIDLTPAGIVCNTIPLNPS